MLTFRDHGIGIGIKNRYFTKNIKNTGIRIKEPKIIKGNVTESEMKMGILWVIYNIEYTGIPTNKHPDRQTDVFFFWVRKVLKSGDSSMFRQTQFVSFLIPKIKSGKKFLINTQVPSNLAISPVYVTAQFTYWSIILDAQITVLHIQEDSTKLNVYRLSCGMVILKKKIIAHVFFNSIYV